MEHLSNCHGEWLIALQILATIPLFGTWIRARFFRDKDPDPEGAP